MSFAKTPTGITIGIGHYRYRAPRKCKLTSWAERLYDPKYDDPAFVYVRRKELERSRVVKWQREENLFLKLAVVYVLVAVIVLYFKNNPSQDDRQLPGSREQQQETKNV